MNVLAEPPWPGSFDVACVGANGGGEAVQPSIEKGPDGNAAPPPDHGVNSVSAL